MSLPAPLQTLVLLAVAMASFGCSHIQQPQPASSLSAKDLDGVGGSGSDLCAHEQVVCFDRCWNSRPPLISIRKGSEKHHEYCTTRCLNEYMKCVKEQENAQQPQKLNFPDIDRALSWLGEHKTEVAIGTLVVVLVPLLKPISCSR